MVLSYYFFGTGLWYKSQYLREAQVNILADDVCRHEDYYASKITDNMFCAGRPDWSQDACQVFPTSPGWMVFGFSCLECLVDSLCIRLFLAGRLRRAAGMWGRPQALAVWCDQLGRGLRKGVSSGRLHQGDQLQPVDREEIRAVVYYSWLPVLPQLNSQTRAGTDLVTLWKFMRHRQYTVNIGEFLDIGEGMLCCCYSTDLDVRKENC